MDSTEITKLYRERFGADEAKKKNELWKVLCAGFFQKYVPDDSIVLDVAAGYCEFINNIRAHKKYAIDLNPDASNFANSDVELHSSSAINLDFLPNDSVDVVFLSNFLEHLDSKEVVLQVLCEIHRVCKPAGRVMILQPNIKYAYREYWDFFDHRIPLSDKSLVEALHMAGFTIQKSIPKFLPYTTKCRLPQSAVLVRLYLHFPLAWHVLGKQAFIVAGKQ